MPEQATGLPIADMRREYTLAGLSEADASDDPFEQFATWFRDAMAANVVESNAMTVATATRDGRPSARMVLLKGFDADGFVFFTNYGSRKGGEIDENPQAALLFYWAELTRQIRIEGTIAQVSAQESDDYYNSRSPLSRLGAWASHQSSVIADRSVLEAALAEMQQRYPGEDIPRPPFWGGYRLTPQTFEFWHGRPNRLHDRLRYSLRSDGGWTI